MIKSEDQSDMKESFMCLNLNKEQSTIKPNYYSGLNIAFVPCYNVEQHGNDYGVDY